MALTHLRGFYRSFSTVMITLKEEITFTTQGKIAVITFNPEKKLNGLTRDTTTASYISCKRSIPVTISVSPCSQEKAHSSLRNLLPLKLS